MPRRRGIPYQLTAFKKHYREYAAQTKATMHINRKPGETMEVDWAGQTAQIVDCDTGEILVAYVFVAALPYSGYAYAEAFLSQGQEAWTAAHAEWLSRQNKKLHRLLKEANLRVPEACLEDVDYTASRKLERAQVARLSDLSWIDEGRNLFITGACCTGKTWLASAFGNAACRQGMKVQSLRVNRLLGDLLAARNNGTWAKLLVSLKKPDLLILDDFGLSTMDPPHCRDLLEIVDDRYGRSSILVTAQLPVSGWHSLFEDPTIADAVLDRLVHNAYRIALHGPSMRHKPVQDGVAEGVSAAANP